MKVYLENEIVRATLNTFAGTIESLIDKRTGEEHYWQYDSARWPRRTSVCFPICGGLIDNTYYYKGKAYQLPGHGFVREMEMHVEEMTDTRLVMSLTDNEETRKMYPFPFRFVLDQRLEGDSLLIEYIVTNTGEEDMLFSTGSHYAYALPAPQSECRYWFEGPQQAGSHTQKSGIIGPKLEDVFKGRDYLSMDHMFDIRSTILELCDLTSTAITIGTAERRFTRVESWGFQYVILWAPPGNDSPFACLEPWAGMADFLDHNQQFEEKRGIIRLSAGETRRFLQKVTLLP